MGKSRGYKIETLESRVGWCGSVAVIDGVENMFNKLSRVGRGRGRKALATGYPSDPGESPDVN